MSPSRQSVLTSRHRTAAPTRPRPGPTQSRPRSTQLKNPPQVRSPGTRSAAFPAGGFSTHREFHVHTAAQLLQQRKHQGTPPHCRCRCRFGPAAGDESNDATNAGARTSCHYRPLSWPCSVDLFYSMLVSLLRSHFYYMRWSSRLFAHLPTRSRACLTGSITNSIGESRCRI